MDHFFNIQTKTIRCCKIENECSETIWKCVKDVIEKYNINVISITSDNARNVSKAAKNLGYPHIRCILHTLQLSINQSVSDDIQSVIDFFTALGKELRKPSSKLLFDANISNLTVTRWNSLYLMLKDIYDIKEKLFEYYKKLEFGYVENENLLFYCNREKVEYSVLDNLIEILKPFYDLTHIIESRDCSCGMALLRVKKVLFELKDNYPEKVQKFINDIKTDFERRIKIINQDSKNIILLCCLLDVRVKAFISKKMIGFTEEEYEAAKSKLLEVSNGIESEEQYISTTVIKNDLDKYLQSPPKKRRITKISEIRSFLEYDETYSTSDNIAEIWMSLKGTFPLIYRIAQQYLSVQISSSEVERLFSNAGFLSSVRRSNLSSDHLEMKLLISRNR